MAVKSKIANSPTPTQTSLPTPTTSQTAEPIPVAMPSESLSPFIKSPTSFTDLVENYLGISSVVWNEAQKLHTSGLSRNNFLIEQGISTKLPLGAEEPIKYLSKASQLWSNFNQPSTTKVFIYNFADLSWAMDKNRSLGGSNFTPQDLSNNCGSVTDCNSFGGAFNGIGQLFIGVSQDPYTSTNSGFKRANFAHEYTHTVQSTLLGAPANLKLPCWFAEGQPQVVGQSLGFETLADYQKSRESWFRQSAGALGDYSPDSILKFYTLTGSDIGGTCSQPVRPRVYDVGYMTVEALASIKGIQSTMEVVAKVGQGMSFSQSFKSVYGAAWVDVSKILAKVVSLEFSNK